MGLPYHQASIRQLEMPPQKPAATGLFTRAADRAAFLRYGYGDLLREDRRYGVLHRIWPGTQRLLLWGDPGVGRRLRARFQFLRQPRRGIDGPLSFKGRIGSGLPGGRCAYADKSLEPGYDFEKYAYQYRVWGRLLYNPEAHPDGWRRYLRHEFGVAAQPAEEALANASRILPIVTTTHGVSGSNNSYWPEIYTNMPIVDAARRRRIAIHRSPAPLATSARSTRRCSRLLRSRPACR